MSPASSQRTVVEADVPVAAPVEHAQHVHALHLLAGGYAAAALDALLQVQLDGGRGLSCDMLKHVT
jgi:acyl-coenzyme A thioesterase PaaI-like protein